MDLIKWSLSAIFSTIGLGFEEPICPDGTFAAGYMRDSLEVWRLVCLAPLSVADIEDLFLFGLTIIGILLLGMASLLVFRTYAEVGRAVQSHHRLPDTINTIDRVINQIVTLNRYLDVINEKLDYLRRDMDELVFLTQRENEN